MVICLERDADLYMAQLMPLPLAVSCFSKIQIGFTFLVPAHLGSPGKRAIKRVWWWWLWWVLYAPDSVLTSMLYNFFLLICLVNVATMNTVRFRNIGLWLCLSIPVDGAGGITVCFWRVSITGLPNLVIWVYINSYFHETFSDWFVKSGK